MTARDHLRLYSAAGTLLWIVVAFVVMAAFAAGDAGAVQIVLVGIAVGCASEWLYPRFVEPRLRRRLLLRLDMRLRASLEQPARARAVLDEIADGYRSLGLASDLYLQLMTGVILTVEKRWREARAVLEAIDPKTIEHPSDLGTYCVALLLCGLQDSPYR